MKIPVWAILVFPLILYLIWEIYWYSQVGLSFIRWHTHLALYVFMWVAGVLALAIFFKNNFFGKIQNAFLVFSSVLFSLFLVEFFLVLSGTFKTYLERVTGSYISHYSPLDKTYYHTWTPNKPHWLTKPEYSYWRPTNSMGFPDEEWKFIKQPNERRILILGDSFTEGDGAPYDSSFVTLLKKKLLGKGDYFYLMNAGVCGSDPFNSYINLRDRLLVYQPDLIIQALSTSDITTDILLRGGMSRFQNDGTVKYTSAPWWEPIYALSYISRLFFIMNGYTELLRNQDIQPQEEIVLNKTITSLFMQYALFCKNEQIKLCIVVRPDRSEIENNSYAYDILPILDTLKGYKHVEILDLLPDYRSYINKNYSKPSDYFWKQDGHHNSKGYEMMATSIFENLLPVLIDSNHIVSGEEKLTQ